jgi:Gamma-glutamyl cyclotransferase, AIG2-like
MDNARDLPGYKYYVDPHTGERPAIYVAFLDIAEDPGASTDGVVFPVDADRLARLDARERNYRRVEVEVDPPTGGATYAYVGTPDARARFEAGRRGKSVFVARAYLEATPGSSAPPPVPIRDLERVDLGPLD